MPKDLLNKDRIIENQNEIILTLVQQVQQELKDLRIFMQEHGINNKKTR